MSTMQLLPQKDKRQPRVATHPRSGAVRAGHEATTRFDSQLRKVTLSAARRFSRRNLLKATGGSALSLGLSTALLGTRVVGPVGADGNCNGPCGPSNWCNSGNCNSSTFDCAYAYARGPHEGYNCVADGTLHSWYEGPYCPPCNNNIYGVYLCVDCCSNVNVGSGNCINTGYCPTGTWYACLCKFHTYGC